MNTDFSLVRPSPPFSICDRGKYDAAMEMDALIGGASLHAEQFLAVVRPAIDNPYTEVK